VVAARVLADVLGGGRSLSAALPLELDSLDDPGDRAFVQEVCYGVMRWYERLAAVAAALLDKPLRRKDFDVYSLVLVGLYQIMDMRVPEHAAVAETVSAAVALKKNWARGLLNAVLRNFIRRSDALLEEVDRMPAAACAHPAWLLERLKKDWPDHWRDIVAANNARPPMVLRVNRFVSSRDNYLATLLQHDIPAAPHRLAPDGIVLERPVGVDRLPGFQDGVVSVQDGAAQLATLLLDPRPNERVLDACAAPGGKTCHLREYQPALADLVAVDIDDERLQRVRDNLHRLALAATVVCADVADTDQWWDGNRFDRILLDAPCSGTGVIRRHPDIKALRKEGDIHQLAENQQILLRRLWPLLNSGGILLYVTCSVLRAENHANVAAFLEAAPDAALEPLSLAAGVAGQGCVQILPGQSEMDGFFYARIKKKQLNV
jgi:16S rRNA (cytosine967-C5)-methyltransferase